MTQMPASGSASSAHIAVVGMSCRFPGATEPETFWRNLREGREAISFFSDEDLLAEGVNPTLIHHPNYVKAAAVLSDIDQFDATLFAFSPREAEILDPQQRIFLECAWEALEDAGCDPALDEGPCGVFAGTGVNTYLLNNLHGHGDLLASVGSYHLMLANDKDYLATRVSYKLNLRGPSVTVQTACSTSLAAVHLACQSLLSGECDVALAGGVSVRVPQRTGYLYQEGMILSPDGHCRAFDADAQGTVGGNGAGIVVLKRLTDALAHGDCIRAVIRGSAMNNDGSLKAGFTAPSVDGQAAVISEAIAVAGIDADTISYIEAHGTGTPIGDPIELAALDKVFRTGTRRRASCAIGSVKTNLGHLDTAAGIAGLIKAILALQHEEIPPSLHYRRSNPALDLENSPFHVNNTPSEWRRQEVPRRAGVSSFGIGGTNVHVVLEEAPPDLQPSESRPWHLLVLSANSKLSLNTAAGRLVEYLRIHPATCLADVAQSLSRRRTDFPHRLAVVHDSATGAAEALADCELGSRPVEPVHGRPVIFMFPGQGSQYVNMGLELYNHEPSFRRTVDYCSELLQARLGRDLRKVLYPRPGAEEDAEQALAQTFLTQPAIFVIEYALAALWMEWGITPEGMIGHSLGEYVAACLSGVFSLEDTLTLVAERARLMQQVPGGSMLAVPLPAGDVQHLLNSHLTVAAVNAPSQCVVSGDITSIRLLHERFEQEQVACSYLNTSHAFHSGMMDSVVDSFTRLVAGTERRPPRIPYISNVTGDWITDAEATDARYWSRHLRQTVRFADGLTAVFRRGECILLEVGPGRALGAMAKRSAEYDGKSLILRSMRPGSEAGSDCYVILESLRRMWLENVPVNWTGLYKHRPRRHTPLPTYSFDRQRYWVQPAREANADFAGASHNTHEGCLYVPTWTRCLTGKAGPIVEPTPASWLVFADSIGIGAALGAELRRRGYSVTIVTAGECFVRLAEGEYAINPGERDDYSALVRDLNLSGRLPKCIAHMWNVTAEPDEAKCRPFYSLLYLAQSLGDLRIETNIKLAVISSHLQDVTGSELLQPEKALLLGPVAVIPQEYSNITCKSIDIDSAQGNRTQMVLRLVEEASRNYSEPAVAYRGRHRWVQRFVPTSLEKAPKEEIDTPGTSIRDGGVYIIAGGTGGVGLALAESIAMSAVNPVIALIGRTASSTNTDQDSTLSAREAQNGQTAFDLDGRAQDFAAWEQALRASGPTPDHTAPDWKRLVDELCTSLVCEYFQRRGITIKPGQAYSKRELLDKLRITPQFKKFLEFFLKILAEDSVLGIHNGSIIFQKSRDRIRSARTIGDEAVQTHPDVACILNLLLYCGEHYDRALSGDIEAISVLYPEGELSPLVSAVEEHGDQYNRRFVPMELLGQILSRFGQDSGRTIRILEIGAGNGELTWRLLKFLGDTKVEYMFTDIGKSFVVKAERKAAELNFDCVRFGVLDISADPHAQGFPKGGFDVIVGLDVVHATSRIHSTLAQVNSMLTPGGLLCLLETVKEQRWTDMVFGLAEGWWYFEDTDFRTTSPLLSIQKWMEVLNTQKYRSVQVFPKDPDDWDEAEFGLFVAQSHFTPTSPDEQRRLPLGARKQVHSMGEKRRTLEHLRGLGATVRVLDANVADSSQLGTALANVRREFGPIHGAIHAAGTPGGGIIQVKSREDAEEEFASKVNGTLTLHSLLKDDPLDFFVLCSSYTSATGGFGQVSYAAANAFQNAFARAMTCESSNTFITSIAWDRWQNVGMAARLEQMHEQLTQQIMSGGISREYGMEVFRDIVSSRSQPNITVYKGDFDGLLRNSRRYQLQNFEEQIPSLQLHSRPPMQSEYSPPSTETEKVIVQVWQDELGIRQLGVNDHFSELGGDSLIAIRLISRIRQSLEVELRVRALYEHPTVARLSEHVETIRWAGQIAEPAEVAYEEERGSL